MDCKELAKGLKNSNIKEVVELAEAYLALEVAYEELKHRFVKESSDKIMQKHEALFRRLAKYD